MEKREQVFVSSTYVDLKEERQAVIQGLLEADCIPAGMELFPASDDDKWSLIKGVIDSSDYYILIIGGRYGSVDPASDLSYTEMEYDYAVKVGKPIMAFLHGEPGTISADKSELDGEKRDKLLSFRQKAEVRMVRFWKTSDDLDGAVAKSLIKIRKSHPAEGWVRGSYAMTPERERDIAELRAKVSDLTQKLESVKSIAKSSVPEGLADGDDKFLIMLYLRYWDKVELEKPEYKRRANLVYINAPVTWNSIITHIGPELLDESDENKIASELSSLGTQAVADDRSLLPEDYGEVVEIKVDGDSLKDVVVQLFALRIIEHGTKKRQISDLAKYWRLTDLGRDRLMILRAIRHEDLPASPSSSGSDAPS